MEEEDKKGKCFLPTSWAQTLIAVTPREDVENVLLKHRDVELREISSTSRISANIEDSFDINEEDFMSRLPLLIKHVIDFRELELEATRDAEIQTFLQGVPTVGIPTEYKHEASQTMYMSSPCPPAKYSESIIASMKVSPMPAFKNNHSSQTIVTIVPETSQHEAVNYLSRRTYEEHREDLENIVDKEAIILEILNFLLSRAFWISDPVHDRIPSVETKCQETQTVIRYNRNTDSIVLDNETQTKLTCEPRHSNSKLLAEYEETKSFVQSCLRECLGGIEPRIIVDDLIDEIIAKGADRLKYPMKDRLIQTVASYRSRDIKEEDMLRKLKTPVVVDPFEASIVVLPLMDGLLRSTCDEVSRNARDVTKYILKSLIQQAVLTGLKLVAIRKQLQPVSIEQIFDRRRKKIVESMLKKETETAATQTGFAGVPEVTRIKEPKDILCSVCVRQSMCHWCVASREKEDLPLQSTKLLRTQDILLSYNPCYVVATVSEKAKNPHLQPIGLPKKNIEELTTVQLSAPHLIPEETGDVVNKTINILMTPKKSMQTRDSISGWARIIDSTLAKSWSLKADSASDATSVITTRSIPRTYCKTSSQSESVLGLQATKALQILKSTFCTRDACPAIALLTTQERRSPEEDVNEEHLSCDDCTLLNLDRHCKQSINNSQTCARPRIDKFRIVPTRPLSEFRGRI